MKKIKSKNVQNYVMNDMVWKVDLPRLLKEIAECSKRKMCRNALPFDHRITKAINLSAKCKARDILHDIEKNGCRTPFNQKNVESCRRKVEGYKV